MRPGAGPQSTRRSGSGPPDLLRILVSFVSPPAETEELVDELEPGAWGAGTGGFPELGDRRVENLVHDRVRHRLEGRAGLGRGVGQPGEGALHLADANRLEPLAQRDERRKPLDVAHSRA